MEKYAVVIHQEPEGGFWAEVPALPACYSQAETLDELMENVREAISGVLEVMKANGSKPGPNIQVWTWHFVSGSWMTEKVLESDNGLLETFE